MPELVSEHRLIDLGPSTISARVLPARRDSLPTLMFFHEGLGSLARWRDVPDVLAEATGCRTVVASRRGYGDSSPHPGPWPASFLEDEAATELPALLRALGLDDVILIGHSDGGSIALLFAAAAARAADPVRPRVRALVLAAPHVFAEACCVEAIRDLTLAPAENPLHRSLRRLHGDQAADTFSAWTEVWLSSEFRDWNCEAILPSVTCPTLVFQGDSDPYGTHLQTEALARGLGGPLEIVPLAGCGHHPHLERREEFLERTREFLFRQIAATRSV